MGTDTGKKKSDLINYIIIFASAFVTITIFSKSSFLYPFNDWVDANSFMTVGKSIISGKVPYRDLYDHKGPLLYFVHALASLVSRTSFLGVYFVEIVSCFAFLILCYRTARLFLEERVGILGIPALSFLIYSSRSFCHGDSAEELCLPLMMYAVYIITKYFKTGEEPGALNYFLVGLTAGCIFWVKYNMVGFYIGWVLLPVILFIRKKEYKKIGRMILCIGGGVLTATLPVILYFGANHALKDLFKVYFYDNIFLYNNEDGGNIIITLVKNTGKALWKNKILLLMIPVGLIGLRHDKKILIQNAASLLFLCAFTYFKNTVYNYYAFILNIYAVFGVITILGAVSKAKHRILCPLMVAANIIALLTGWSGSSNTYLIMKDKDDMPQYKFKKIIEQTENATLLNYSFLDGGFYTVCNIVPNCKYYCRMNTDNSEMLEMQDKYVDEGLTDFVVTRGEKLESSVYELASSAMYYMEGGYYVYYLYRKTD